MKKRLSLALACLAALGSISAGAATYVLRAPQKGLKPAPTPASIVNNGGVRSWSDNTLATSCNAYLQGDATHQYSGATGDGSYQVNINGTAQNVTCDMTTDGGGWTMVASFDDTAAHQYFSASLTDKGLTGYQNVLLSTRSGNYWQTTSSDGMSGLNLATLALQFSGTWYAAPNSAPFVYSSSYSGLPTALSSSAITILAPVTCAASQGCGSKIKVHLPQSGLAVQQVGEAESIYRPANGSGTWCSDNSFNEHFDVYVR